MSESMIGELIVDWEVKSDGERRKMREFGVLGAMTENGLHPTLAINLGDRLKKLQYFLH